MSWNLPDGCTDYDIDRAAGGYDEPEPEDPDNYDQDDPIGILRRDRDAEVDARNTPAPVAERETKEDEPIDCPF